MIVEAGALRAALIDPVSCESSSGDAWAGLGATRQLVLIHQRDGSAVCAQDGRRIALRAGELTVFDTSRPFSLAIERGSVLLIAVCPDGVGCDPDHLVRMTSVSLSEGPCGSAFEAFFRALGDDLAVLEDVPGLGLARTVREMISNLLASRSTDVACDDALHTAVFRGAKGENECGSRSRILDPAARPQFEYAAVDWSAA